MDCPLLALAFELRRQIFAEVLTSPTGYMTLVKNGHLTPVYPPFPYPDSADDLVPRELLQTCKQINREGTDILFEQNVIYLRDGNDNNNDFNWAGTQQTAALREVKHLWLDIPIHQFGALKTAVKYITDPSRTPHLKNVTLCLLPHSEPQSLSLVALACWYHSGDSFKVPPETLRMARDSLDAHRPNLDRKLVFRYRWEDFAKTQDTYEFHTRSAEITATFVRDMHEAFGGEMWINDTLCYKHGEELANFFESPPPWDHFVVG